MVRHSYEKKQEESFDYWEQGKEKLWGRKRAKMVGAETC